MIFSVVAFISIARKNKSSGNWTKWKRFPIDCFIDDTRATINDRYYAELLTDPDAKIEVKLGRDRNYNNFKSEYGRVYQVEVEALES